MSKIDIGLVLGKAFTVLKKQPLIFIPFLILAFLSAGFTVLTFDYTIEMTQAFQSFGSEYQYEYMASPSDVLEDMLNIFKGMTNLFIISLIGGFVLLIIRVLLYTGTVSVVIDVLAGKKTGLGNFINISLSHGITALLSTIVANIIIFLPATLGFIIFLIALFVGSLDVVMSALIILSILIVLQGLWLLAILFLLSSKIPRIIYIIIAAITLAIVILGIFFPPLWLLLILFLPLLLILIIISMFIIDFTIDYIIPSTVVIDNSGVLETLKKSYIFAKEHTIHLGILILIAFAIILIVALPFGIFSAMMQMGDVMSNDFYSQEPQIYVPTTMDLIIQVIQVSQAILDMLCSLPYPLMPRI